MILCEQESGLSVRQASTSIEVRRAGKSTADIPAIGKAQTSLTLVPTHNNCREQEGVYREHGLVADAYPELNKKTCANYDVAVQAIEAGLSASAAVCPFCPCNSGCDYRDSLASAYASAHRIATHQRARFNMKGLAKGRRFVAIHESQTDLIRPVVEISSGLQQVARVARVAKDSREAGNMSLYHLFFRMEETSLWLLEKLEQAESTTLLDLPPAAARPQ